MAGRTFGPVVVRRRLGHELRRIREEANLRLEAVANELECSPSKISRLENGQAIPKTWDVRNLLTLYDVREEKVRNRLLRWANQSRAQGWWEPYFVGVPNLDYLLSLEAEAAAMSIYCTPYIHSLLQTRDYARAVLSGTLADIDEGTIEQLVDARMHRQDILRRKENPVHLRAVLDEADLHRVIGSSEITAAQLGNLLELPSSVELRVYRLSSGVHPALISPFTIITPQIRDLDPVVVYVESTKRDTYLEHANEVEPFQHVFEDLWRRSDDQTASMALIRSLL